MALCDGAHQPCWVGRPRSGPESAVGLDSEEINFNSVQLPVTDILHFVADDIYWTAGLVSLDGDVVVRTESRIIHCDHQGSSRLVLYNERDFLELSLRAEGECATLSLHAADQPSHS
jgi:hypothetical protein